MALEQKTAGFLVRLVLLLADRCARRHLLHGRGGQRPPYPPLEVLVLLTDVGVRPVVAVLELTVVVTADATQRLARRARLRIEPATAAARDPHPELRFRLIDREREVLALVAEGHSNGKIASVLFISPKTASVHVSNILAKLGATSRTEAATTAHRHGLLTA
jgi:DNA-binding NarL/FixJ family response regulator